MGKFADLTGQRFGRLRVLGIETRRNRVIIWRCLCDCGNSHLLKGWTLRSGESRSCGCLNRDSRIARNTTHGLSRHPAYKIWGAIHKRCSPSADRSSDYYGRGITVCPEWDTFEQFWADMGPTWAKGLTLERQDNDQGYSASNCIWADYYAQANNNRRSHWIETPKGRMTVAQAARAFGINYGTFSARVNKGVTGRRLYRPAANGGREDDERHLVEQIAHLQAKLDAIRDARKPKLVA